MMYCTDPQKSSALVIPSPRMEKKQGLFLALKQEVVRGISPVRSRWKAHSMSNLTYPLISHSGCLRPVGVADAADGGPRRRRRRHWRGAEEGGVGPVSEETAVTGPIGERRRSVGPEDTARGYGAPLAPVHISVGEPLPLLSIKDTPIEASSAQYILQQYTATLGGLKFQSSKFDDVLNQPKLTEDLRKLVDPTLGDDYPIESIHKMAQLAKACTQENPQLRPSMRSIVVALMIQSSSTEDWDMGSFYENQTQVSLMAGR